MCILVILYFRMMPINSFTFLSKVWPNRILTNEMMELRMIDRKHDNIIRGFYSSVQELLNVVKSNSNKDIYFGVATRLGPGGTKSSCYRTRCVWCDFDKGKKIKDCLLLSPRPDILVNSGRGVHAYWLLRSPILVRGEERYTEIESINRGLAKRFGGDDTAVDISRILRIPDTVNHKYDKPLEVKAYLL